MESEGKVIWRVVWENDCESGWERGWSGECEKVQRCKSLKENKKVIEETKRGDGN